MPRPGHGPAIEKSKNFGAAIRRLIKELASFRTVIIFALSLAALSSIISIITPNRLSKLTDTITAGLLTGIDMGEVTRIASLLVALYLTSALCSYLQGYIMTTVTNRFTRLLRQRIIYKINRLPLRYFDHNQAGDVLSRITNDVDTLTQSMGQSISTMVGASALFIGSIIMMFVTNWVMATTAIVASLFGFSFMTIVLKKSQKYFTMRQVELGKLNAHIEEIYSGLLVVKAYNGKADSDRKFDELNRRVYEANRKSQFLSGLMHPMMGFVGNLGYVAVCIVGALLTMNNVISFGVIVAFILYVRLFTSPLSQIAQAMNYLQSTAAASERVFEFLDETELPDESHIKTVLDKATLKGNVEFSHVSFGYNADRTIIKDFSVKVKAGQKVAIVGPTGAGKTTLVNLLMKFYNINSGDIKIDGVSIKDLSRHNIHDLFTMVLQDTWLFAGTIRENITYNHRDITDQQINDVLKTVGLTHFVKTLPHGINSDISENDSVSAGQRQLLTIARSMLEEAPILILDEATSNVDTRMEETIQAAMDKLTEGRTSFVIAHRLSTIKNADLILVLKDGDIVEQGDHASLMKQKGFYADLYNSQFQL